MNAAVSPVPGVVGETGLIDLRRMVFGASGAKREIFDNENPGVQRRQHRGEDAAQEKAGKQSANLWKHGEWGTGKRMVFVNGHGGAAQGRAAGSQ